MPDRRNIDRDAILARRALFISTALAGFACTSDKPSAVGHGDSGDAKGQLVGVDETKQPEEPTPTPWSEVFAAAPPMDIPEGLSAAELQHLRSQTRLLELRYEGLRKMWESMPDCAPTDAACTVWAEQAKTLEPLFERDDFNVGNGCGTDSGRTGTVVGRWAVHDRFQQQLLEKLRTNLDGVAARYGKAGTAAWQQAIARASAPKPMPCLSACAVQLYSDIISTISFAPNAVELSLDQPAALVAEIRRYAGTKVVIRGHADPSEDDPEGLARRRAEAVAAMLAAAGIASSNVEVVGLGATLMIESGEAGLQYNPRVDFEVVQLNSLR